MRMMILRATAWLLLLLAILAKFCTYLCVLARPA
jgi:hypothetical protein